MNRPAFVYLRLVTTYRCLCVYPGAQHLPARSFERHHNVHDRDARRSATGALRHRTYHMQQTVGHVPADATRLGGELLGHIIFRGKCFDMNKQVS